MSDHHDYIKPGWRFDNSYARLPEMFFSRQQPDPIGEPRLVVFNKPLAEQLGLNASALQSDNGAAIFAGNLAPEGAEPIAQAYAGHQFGHFTMLGDGRALLLGEHVAPSGERVDIQLKGSGRTPYSRGGDGRAALGPMLREYIISEGMYALGIPTTRSLAVAATGEYIRRETMLPGAVLTRVAASHLRVGTFQYAAARGATDELRALAEYALRRHYPHAADDEAVGLRLLQEVGRRQAALVAEWQLVGFIHGVMNTDNMAISGETIDYGPCAFMDAYDPETVFSSIDAQGRYAYGNQPHIFLWNLARFAESVLPLIHDDAEKAVDLANEALAEFADLHRAHWLSGMRGKLGMSDERPQDEELVEDLLRMMQKHKADYTNTFVALTFGRLNDLPMSGSSEFAHWHERWGERLERQSPEDTQQIMRSSNPAVIPRNHLVEEALQAAEVGDSGPLDSLLAALAAPYAHTKEQERYAAPPPPSELPYRTFCGT